jgi:hypothetical protein
MPTNRRIGINKTIKTIRQVSTEANAGRSFFLKNENVGLKIPDTTMARIIIDINGHNSHPSRKIDTRNNARKNHKIISRDDLFSMMVPKMGINTWGCQAVRYLLKNAPATSKRRNSKTKTGA